MLLLTTVGRKSGVPRSVTLNYFKEDFEFVVIASNAGDERDPLWWRNLKVNRHAEVRTGRRRFTVRAREAEGAKRERLWAELIARDPSYAEYERTTKRRIPVVLLEPVTNSRRSVSVPAGEFPTTRRRYPGWPSSWMCTTDSSG